MCLMQTGNQKDSPVYTRVTTSEECNLDQFMINHSLQLTFDLSIVTKGGSFYNLF